MKERVSAAVKRRTALTCTFDAISYLPFFGLKLSHFTVPQEAEIAPLTEAPFFHADAMVANVSLWSLFRRPIKLHEVRCVRPTIVSVQLDNGSMALPWPARPVVPPPEIALNTPVIIPDAESTIEVDPIITSSIPSPAATVEEPDTSQAVVETPETITSNKSLSSTPSVQEPSPEPVLPKPPTPSKSVKRIMPQVLWIQRARVIEGRLVLLASDGKRQMLEFQNIAMNLGFDQPWQRGHALPQPTGQLSIQEIHALKMLRVDSLESSDRIQGQPDAHA